MTEFSELIDRVNAIQFSTKELDSKLKGICKKAAKSAIGFHVNKDYHGVPYSIGFNAKSGSGSLSTYIITNTDSTFIMKDNDLVKKILDPKRMYVISQKQFKIVLGDIDNTIEDVVTYLKNELGLKEFTEE